MTIELPEGCRQAGPSDAVAMAELVNMAGEGLPLYLWSGMASPGQSPWELGAERARRETGSFSFDNTIVCEVGGSVAAALIGYPLVAAATEQDYADMRPLLVPLQELEDLAIGTWYVNVLAAYPGFRGQGLGSRLLALAEAIAGDRNLSGLSLIVADANAGARRLYQSLGYAERARRPMVKEGWQGPGESWVLLVKSL